MQNSVLLLDCKVEVIETMCNEYCVFLICFFLSLFILAYFLEYISFTATLNFELK